MAHEVNLILNESIVLHKDIKVEVKADGEKLGTVLISKGNIEWLPAGHHVNKHRLTWARFAELMEQEGKNAKVKK
ncbi:hypothetical protein DZA65_02077 [Dickeya dianthicola]|uniref:Uncharacterized protein n=1 Tax=Dickeya dianthicola TaxID=204039 RepID=A0AAP2D4V4_9GAMM|nr:hypothetical protein [Dickeya dianthicola]ATO33022.1 hypothetical protein DDI_1854 [Dickeya dianthicola RNS04.9]AYC18966.1 hypothetical protein DZA65_02077 [Dickeya dianthicola]MBI0439567.1 hypothetical protein [Dickeya dianthicola]MBI0449965.1 hypothetical protein [Dickeya dianthicola]MBI0454577.1 hypothetical protein [Dickeya dianthicola]